jgi:hypothetical protein
MMIVLWYLQPFYNGAFSIDDDDNGKEKCD